MYSVSHDPLEEIAGSNIMIGSDDVFSKSPHRPKVKQLLNEEGLKVFKTLNLNKKNRDVTITVL